MTATVYGKATDGKHGGYAWKYDGRGRKAVIAGRPRFHVFAAPFFVDGGSKLALLEQLIRRHTMLANSMKLRQQPVMTALPSLRPVFFYHLRKSSFSIVNDLLLPYN